MSLVRHAATSRQSGRMSALLTVGGTGLVLALNVITGILAARALGPTGRGEMTVLGLWSPFVASVTTLGLPSAVNILVRKSTDPVPVFASAAALATGVGIAAGLISAAVLGATLSHQYTPAQVLFAELCVLTVPFNLLLTLAGACYQATGRFVSYNALRILPPSVTVIALLALGLTDSQTPERAILAYLVPTSLTGLVAALCVMKGRIGAVSPRVAVELLRYGLRAYGAEVVGSVGASADRLLVTIRMPTALVGIFFVGRSTADALMGLQLSLAAVLLPKVAGATPGDAARLTGLTVRVGLAATAGAALVIGNLAPELIRLVYGEEFLPATALFRLLLLEVSLTGTAQTLGQAYLGRGRPGAFSLIQVGSLLSTAVVLAIILPGGGLWGTGVTLVAIAALRLLLVWIGFPVVLGLPLPRLWLNLDDLRLLCGRRYAPDAALPEKVP